MTEYAKLVIAVDSTQAAKARTELDKLPAAAGKAEGAASRMGATFARVGGIMASALSVREVIRAADQYANLTNRLRLVTSTSEQLAYAQQAVMRSALETYQPLETTAEVYQRIAQNANALGLSFEEVESITKTVSRTIALSGADTQSAAGAMRQFGQALASGSLRGDELNSILEGTPALAQAIARGLGVTTGELRTMGAEGQLTSTKIVAALQSQEGAVEEMSRTMNVTASQAMVAFGNSLVGIVGKLDDTTSASRQFASAILELTSAMNRFGSGEFMDFFRDSKQTAEGFNNEISVTLSKIRDLTDIRSRLDKGDPDDTVLFRFKFWNKEELDAEISGLNGQVQRFQEARDRLVELANKPGQETPKGDNTGSPLTPQPSTIDSATKAIQRQIAALELQADTLGMSATEASLHKLAMEGATPTQLSSARAALQSVEAYQKQAEAIRQVNEADESTNRDAISIIDSLMTEEEAIRASYERRRQTVLDSTILTAEARNEAMIRLEQERDEKLLGINGGYWERYLAAAEDSLGNFDELAGNVIDNFGSRFGSTIESMVFDAQSLSDAVSGLAEGMARSVINALGEMAAQWVAYHAVQLMLGKSSETTAVASAAIAGTSIAAAYAPAAAMASLASFGANAVPAMAGITSTVGLSQTMALAGMAHDGIDSVPREGTWLLDKGERVVDQRTNADLKNFLSSEGRSSAPPNIQIINNGDPVSAKAEMDGDTLRIILDRVQSDFIGSLQNDGRYSKAIANTYGLRRSGL